MPRAAAITALAGLFALVPLAGPHSAAADVPLPRSFSVESSACPEADVPACAYTTTATIYVEPGQDAFVFWHELGHIFDYQRLTDGDRNWFTRMVGLTGAWDQGTGIEGLHSPKERFADAYATCALNWRPDRGEWDVAYDYQPTLKRHRKICAAINRVGERS